MKGTERPPKGRSRKAKARPSRAKERAARRKTSEKTRQRPEEEGDEFLGISMNLDKLPDYVKGMENPNESIQNPIRWMIKNGYSDGEISKVMGGNAIRVLEQVWPN